MRYFAVLGSLRVLASGALTLVLVLTLTVGAQAQNSKPNATATLAPAPAASPAPVPAFVPRRWKAVGQPTETTRHNFSCKTTVLHYEFVVLAGNRLSIDTSANTYKEAPVGPDGNVDYSFQSAKLSYLRVTGNINHPETMKVLNTDGNSCEWLLVPVQ